MVRVLSLFSGIGATELAMRKFGWETVGFCEIDPYPVSILKKRFPGIPIFPDVTKLNKEMIEEVIRKNDKYADAVHFYETGMSMQEVGALYGITRQAMWDILKRRGVKARDNKRYGAENHFYRGGSTASDYAQNVLEKAIQRGDIKRQHICEKCGASGTFSDGRDSVQAHHCDYNKPLEVMWLCQKCHHEWHKTHQATPRREVMPNGSHANEDGTVDLICGGFPQ